MSNDPKPIAPDAPEIPANAIEFARRVAELTEEYNIRDATIEMRIDKCADALPAGHRAAEKMRISISRRDGRGRPRMQVDVAADITVSVPMIWEQDSSN